MTEEEMKYLEKESRKLQDKAIAAHTKMCSVREEYVDTQNNYNKAKVNFDNVDRQLAMVDGRFKKIKSSTPGRIKKKDISVNLSGDQVIRIAEVLGIELEIE